MVGFSSDGEQLTFGLRAKVENMKNVQRECETCLGLKLKQLQKRQQECSPQILWCLSTPTQLLPRNRGTQ